MSQNKRIVCGERVSRTISDRFSDSGIIGKSFAQTPFGASQIGAAVKRLMERFDKYASSFDRPLPRACFRMGGNAMRSAQPWSIGGWRSADLVFLSGLAELMEEEEAIEQVEQKRPVSAWTGARRSSSPWFSRPYTPARVAKKQARRQPSVVTNQSASSADIPLLSQPVPRKRLETSQLSPALRTQQQTFTASSGKPQRVVKNTGANDEPPMRRQKIAPLQRAALRLESSQAQQSSAWNSIAQLPPFLARSKRVWRALTNDKQGSTATPVQRLIAELQQPHIHDAQLTPVALAKGRLPKVGGKKRGLRPALHSSPMLTQLQPVAESMNPQQDAIAAKPVSGWQPRTSSPWLSRRQPQQQEKAKPALRSLVSQKQGDVDTALRPQPAQQERSDRSQDTIASTERFERSPAPSAHAVQRAALLQENSTYHSLLPAVTPFSSTLQAFPTADAAQLSQAAHIHQRIDSPFVEESRTLDRQSPQMNAQLTRSQSRRLQMTAPQLTDISSVTTEEQTPIEAGTPATVSGWAKSTATDSSSPWLQHKERPNQAAYAARRRNLAHTEHPPKGIMPRVTPQNLSRIGNRQLAPFASNFQTMISEVTRPSSSQLAPTRQQERISAPSQQQRAQSRKMRTFAPQQVALATSTDVDTSSAQQGVTANSVSAWPAKQRPTVYAQERRQLQQQPRRNNSLLPRIRSEQDTYASSSAPKSSPPKLIRSSAGVDQVDQQQALQALRTYATTGQMSAGSAGKAKSQLTSVQNRIQSRNSFTNWHRDKSAWAEYRFRRPAPLSYARSANPVFVMPAEASATEDSVVDSASSAPSAWGTSERPASNMVPPAKNTRLDTTESNAQEPSEEIGARPLDHMLARFDLPTIEPEWISVGMARDSYLATVGARRLSPKPMPLSHFSPSQQMLDVAPADAKAEEPTETNRVSPWFTRAADPRIPAANQSSFAARQQKMLQKMSMPRTYRHASGAYVDAKDAQKAGFSASLRRSKMRMPLAWTLEAVDLKSSNDSLPVWARRASEKPLVRGSDEFVQALVRASSTEDVIRVIFERAQKSSPQLRNLPSTATQVIEQIRKEAHKVESKQLQQRDVAASRLSPAGSPRRRTARVVKGFTGLRPLSTANTEAQQAKDDKVVQLAKRLEDLVLLAENESRHAARMGVRMAEDSHEAIEEGKASSKGEDSPQNVDANLDALYLDVLHAVENMLAMRRMLRPDNPDQFDGGW